MFRVLVMMHPTGYFILGKVIQITPNRNGPDILCANVALILVCGETPQPSNVSGSDYILTHTSIVCS